MKILCVFGEHNYGDPKRGEGYEYSNFMPALRRLGHEVTLFDSLNKDYYQNFTQLNQALLRKVEQERPDMILAVSMHYEIWTETWEILRDSGIVAMVNWATDDSWKYDQFSKLVAPAFHAFTTTYSDSYKRYQKDGYKRVLLTQWAANAEDAQPPLAARQCKYEVSFVGTMHGQRAVWIEALKQQGINVSCFGHGWPSGAIAAEEIPFIMRNSRISLNFANSLPVWEGMRRTRVNQIKARTFEVPGAGGFLLTESAKDLDKYYEIGKEIAVFEDQNELAKQIKYYLSHEQERDDIAVAGYEKTISAHTYDRRFEEIIEFTLKQRDEYFAAAKINPTMSINWDKFSDAARRHSINGGHKMLQRVLVSGSSLLFGRQRGPRAARRLSFELSWRLFGARTYTASGWPGRMFYRWS